MDNFLTDTNSYENAATAVNKQTALGRMLANVGDPTSDAYNTGAMSMDTMGVSGMFKDQPITTNEVANTKVEDTSLIESKLAPLFERNDALAGGNVSESDIYPLGNTPIQTGNYSLAGVGSFPIYTAPAALVPVGFIENRRKNLAAAAATQRETKEKMLTLAMAGAAPQYKRQIQDMQLGMVEKYKDEYGAGFFDKLPSVTNDKTGFWKEYYELVNLGEMTMHINGIADAVMKDVLSDKRYVPDTVKQAVVDWKAGTSDLESFRKNPKEMEKMASELTSYSNLMSFIADPQFKPAIESQLIAEGQKIFADEATPQDVKDAMIKTAQSGNGELFSIALLKSIPDSRLDGIVQQIRTSGNFLQKDGEIKQILKDYYGRGNLEIKSTEMSRFTSNNRGGYGTPTGWNIEPVQGGSELAQFAITKRGGEYDTTPVIRLYKPATKNNAVDVPEAWYDISPEYYKKVNGEWKVYGSEIITTTEPKLDESGVQITENGKPQYVQRKSTEIKEFDLNDTNKTQIKAETGIDPVEEAKKKWKASGGTPPTGKKPLP